MSHFLTPKTRQIRKKSITTNYDKYNNRNVRGKVQIQPRGGSGVSGRKKMFH